MIRMTSVCVLLMYVRTGDPVTRNAHSERREETEPLGDPSGRPDVDHGSRLPGPGRWAAVRAGSSDGVRGVQAEARPRLPDRERRGPARLGDHVVLAIGVALDLEFDP